MVSTPSAGVNSQHHPPPNRSAVDLPHFSQSPVFSYSETPGHFVLEFGRFKGRTLSECPNFYVQWLATEHDWPHIREAAQAFLNWCGETDPRADPDPEPSPDLAAVVLPGIIFRWWQAMFAELGDDPFALVIVNRCLVELQILCTQYTHRPWLPEGEEMVGRNGNGGGL